MTQVQPCPWDEASDGDDVESIEATCSSGDQHQTDLDVGQYCVDNAGLPQDVKYKLLTKPWTPPVSYVFPSTLEAGRSRKFNRSWLAQFPWLAYSDVKMGAFCKHCVLFANRHPPCGTVGALVITPLQRFKKALETMRAHELTSFHADAMNVSQSFLHAVESGTNVVQMGNTALQDKIAHNRQLLQSVVETIQFCGRQNIALRGHRDDGPLPVGMQSEGNEGNFRELLKFRISSGDKILEAHVNKMSGNVTLISKTTQNDIIHICGQVILEKNC